MQRFISGELKKIFRANSHNLFIGLTVDAKHAWQQEVEEIPVLHQLWINTWRSKFEQETDSILLAC